MLRMLGDLGHLRRVLLHLRVLDPIKVSVEDVSYGDLLVQPVDVRGPLPQRLPTHRGIRVQRRMLYAVPQHHVLLRVVASIKIARLSAEDSVAPGSLQF